MKRGGATPAEVLARYYLAKLEKEEDSLITCPAVGSELLSHQQHCTPILTVYTRVVLFVLFGDNTTAGW